MPSLFNVPPITLSPTFFETGIDSPVTMDSSIAEEPRITVESIGIFSPGLTKAISPGWISSIGISTSSPVSFLIFAVFG